MNIKEALRLGTKLLLEKGIDSSSLDSRLLLQHALNNCSQEWLLINFDSLISEDRLNLYFDLIHRRTKYEPIAKIIGKKPFWDAEFMVNSATLDPRPDSESIILGAKKLLNEPNKNYRFLDLGTGSGCLILSLLREFPNATAIATDVSEAAIKVAVSNANNLNLHQRIQFNTQNWADDINEKFDLIVSNPPYIPSFEINNLSSDVKNFDPLTALDGGEDGLDHYRYLSKQILHLLNNEGYAILEFGQNQHNDVANIFMNYEIVDFLYDLSSVQRAIVLRVK